MKRALPTDPEGTDSGFIAEARHDSCTPCFVVLKVRGKGEAVLTQQAATLKHLHRGVHARPGAAEAAGQI